MSLIDLQLDNKEIIQKHFSDLCCDDFTYPFLSGGQSNADNALNQLNIDKYATKRNNVYPCLLYTSPSPRDRTRSRMPSSA